MHAAIKMESLRAVSTPRPRAALFPPRPGGSVCRHRTVQPILFCLLFAANYSFFQNVKQVTVLGGRERSVTSAHDTVLQGVVSLQPPTVWHVASGLCVPNDGSVAPTAFDYRYTHSPRAPLFRAALLRNGSPINIHPFVC